ncbi:hypothetical protein IE81DRAFT_326527 [Ceraceosorus guamensis]|uniref:DH domain-containing protein n=1 Tax=Ceraceosorus guamensis TaxID=1522189 RepID=A0A316VVI3_9BASI|nr:hypothetical protein IE81DRAFT_326527 [Ceraceosorus guamensis]PWN39455.1 hypothetical protein IE81DRAFT_326527 [Ceraceosorus guamensis]
MSRPHSPFKTHLSSASATLESFTSRADKHFTQTQTRTRPYSPAALPNGSRVMGRGRGDSFSNTLDSPSSGMAAMAATAATAAARDCAPASPSKADKQTFGRSLLRNVSPRLRSVSPTRFLARSSPAHSSSHSVQSPNHSHSHSHSHSHADESREWEKRAGPAFPSLSRMGGSSMGGKSSRPPSPTKDPRQRMGSWVGDDEHVGAVAGAGASGGGGGGAGAAAAAAAMAARRDSNAQMQMLDASVRPPARSSIDTGDARRQHAQSHSHTHSPSHARTGSRSTPIAAAIGTPSSRQAQTPINTTFTAESPTTDRMMREAEERRQERMLLVVDHWDAVLEKAEGEQAAYVQARAAEGGASSAILPHLGSVVLDQSGAIDTSDAFLPHSAVNTPGLGLTRSDSEQSISRILAPDQRGAGNATAAWDAGNAASADKPKSSSSSAFEARLAELLETERSYVRRIDTLANRYAAPLRALAVDSDTAVIPRYEAQRLFGNIGEIVGANRAFLSDLEKCVKGGKRDRDRLGDVVHRHMACFACYNEYFANFEKAKHIEQSMTRSNRAFRDFVERTKYGVQGMGNIGLRELLMEPVQRIPRYTLLLDAILRHMQPGDPRRARIQEAVGLAGRIASCEVDEKTRRAAVMWGCKRSIDGFPDGLISVHRGFIDCIDVEDFPMDLFGPAAAAAFSPGSVAPGGSAAAGAAAVGTGRVQHCSLFLFDDCLVILKRSSTSICARQMVGLEDINRLADQMRTFVERSGTSSSSSKAASNKMELGFRGTVDLSDIKAVDAGGNDFVLRFAKGPAHCSGEKWAGRLSRCYATHDTYNASLGSSALSPGKTTPALAAGYGNDNAPGGSSARSEKMRFLENLWRAQAMAKTKEGRSYVRCSISESLQSADEIPVRRLTYWNVYTRRAFLAETSKSVVALQVDIHGEADQLPFGTELAPPHATLRIHSIDEDTGRFSYTTAIKGSREDDEEMLLPLRDLDDQMRTLGAHAIKRMHDFDPSHHAFGMGTPTTPSSHRGRVAQGLETLSRNLFGTPGSVKNSAADPFALSNGHVAYTRGSPATGASTRRTKSSHSKTSSLSGAAQSISARTYSTAATSVGSREMLRGFSAGGALAQNSPDVQAYLKHGTGTPARLGVPLRGNASSNTPDRFRRAASLGAEANTSIGDLSADQCDLTPRYSASGSGQRLDVLAGAESPSKDASARQRTRSTPARPSQHEQEGEPLSPRSPPVRRKPVPGSSAGLPAGAHALPSELEADGPRVAKRVTSASKRSAPDDDASERAPKRSHGSRQQSSCLSASESLQHGRGPSPIGPRRATSTKDQGDGRPRTRSGLSEADWMGSSSASSISAEKDPQGSEMERTLQTLVSSCAAHSADLKELQEEVYEVEKGLKRRSIGDGPGLEARDADKLLKFLNAWIGEATEKQVVAADELVALQEHLARMSSAKDEARPAETSAVLGLQKDLRDLEAETVGLRRDVGEMRQMQSQVEVLKRKCELLTQLEKDGRLENTALHKAFNEELDGMWEDAQGSRDEELAALRREVKSSKSARNEANMLNSSLRRELEVEKAQAETYRRLLMANGLLPETRSAAE